MSVALPEEATSESGVAMTGQQANKIRNVLTQIKACSRLGWEAYSMRPICRTERMS